MAYKYIHEDGTEYFLHSYHIIGHDGVESTIYYLLPTSSNNKYNLCDSLPSTHEIRVIEGIPLVYKVRNSHE